MIPRFFKKEKIPEKLPEGMEKAVLELKNSASKEECLRRAYEIITGKYHGQRFVFLLKIFGAFKNRNINKLWDCSGYLHCTFVNYLLRVLLVKSGFFEEDDISFGYSLSWWISPHQYFRIKISENKSVNVDPWFADYGIKLGDFAHGFHCGTISKKKR